MTKREKEEFLQYLSNYITENKWLKFEEVLKNRTRHITVVLEDIFQSHNASAVLRSCDVFGIQDVHIIENKNTYELNPKVELGTSKWLNLCRYSRKDNNTVDCLNSLKEKGYKIIATTPNEKDCTLDELDITSKTALLFGTEKLGLSPIALENADGFVKIPMYGFAESLNISVSAALCLRHLYEKLITSGLEWQLSDSEQLELKLEWAKKVVKRASFYEKEFFAKRQNLV